MANAHKLKKGPSEIEAKKIRDELIEKEYRRNKGSINGILLGGLAGLVMCAVLFSAIHSFVSLPTVATTIEGKCVYIQCPDGQKLDCGDELPSKYHHIRVAEQ